MPTDYGTNGNGRPLSFEDYQRLLAAGQRWVADAQAKDPEWQAWQRARSSYSAENADQAPASPTKDYWGAWRATLAPEVSADFNRHMADSRSWTDDVGKALKVGIPLMVGGAALAGTGLFGAGLQGAVGGAPLGGATGAAGTAAGAAAGDLAGSVLPAFDTGAGGLFGSQAAIDSAMTSAGWYPGASMAAGTEAAGGLMLGDLMPAGYQNVMSTPGLLDRITNLSPRDVANIAQRAGGLLGGNGQTDEGYPMGGAGGRQQPAALQAGGAGGMAPFRPHNGLADILRTMPNGTRQRGLMDF